MVPSLNVEAHQYGSIHVNFQELLMPEKNVSDLRVARTIIHEASHKFCNTQDYAYASPAQLYQITPSFQMLWNADSYAFCAVSLYRDAIFQTDEDMAAG